MGEHIHRHRHEAMLSVEEARERILRFFDVLPTEDAPILDAQGQVLAEDVLGAFDIPSLDNSAMDGFAVQSDSLRGRGRLLAGGASGRRLRGRGRAAGRRRSGRARPSAS